MRYAVVGMALALMIMMAPAMAAKNYQMEGNDFAAAMLRNTISNLEIGNKFLDVLNAANDSATVQTLGWYVFQNLWGIAYGGLVIAGWNNQITATVLDAIATNDTDLTYVGLAFSYLGSNASTVFGNPNGDYGLAMLFKNQTQVLANTSYTYQAGETILQAYARALAETMVHDVVALIKLAKAIPAAFT
ncbi:hypothetical protein [Archaeoglobus sp.]